MTRADLDACTLPPCTSTSSTGPTSCSASTSAWQCAIATPAPNAAALGVLASTLQLVADGATHVGVASDTVIESFRNDLWPGYKTSDGMAHELLDQIPVMEELLVEAGFTMWGMVEYEADDALGAAAAVAEADRARDEGDDPHARQGPVPVRP